MFLLHEFPEKLPAHKSIHALLFSVVLLSGAGLARADNTTLISINASGTGSGSNRSFSPKVTPDARYVVFESDAIDLVGNDANGWGDVFVHDTQTSTTVLTSVNLAGTGSGSSVSSNPSITPDGRYIVFQSNANNLVANDSNGFTPDVYVRDTETNTTILASVNAAGTGSGNGQSFDASITPDGSHVVFESTAGDLVGNDTNANSNDVFIRNMHTSTTTLVSTNAGGTGSGDSISTNPSITPDGNYVVFESLATNLVANDTNGTKDVFRRDIQAGTTILVSVNASGSGGANHQAINPSITPDGRYVVFESVADNIVANDNNGTGDVFVRDTQMNTTTLVSVNAAGTGAGNNYSYGGSITPDGRYVVFQSVSSDLVANDTNGLTEDVYVRDLHANTTTLVSVNAAGSGSGNNQSLNATITPDGRYVIFESNASDLVANDTNASSTDVFVRDLQTSTTLMASVNQAGTGSGNSISLDGAITPDGHYAVFESLAGNLVANDSNGTFDVFLANTLPLSSASLPNSRSVQVGNSATAFASVINAGNAVATNCSISPITVISADFLYQTTDPISNMLTGTVNTPFDINAGETQTLFFAATPTAPIDSTEIQLSYDCENTHPAKVISGVNTLLLSAENTPVADIIGLTTVVDLVAPVGNTTLFAVASSNVGVTDTITVSLGTGETSLPVNLNLCQTDPLSGVCTSAIGPETTFSYASATSATFAIFVTPTGVIDNDPANNRIFVQFRDSMGVVRGTTSTAVRTQ